MPWVSAQRLGRDRMSIGDKQEGMPIDHMADEPHKKDSSGLKRRPAPPPPFRFGYRRQPIDWRILHGIDIHRMVRLVNLQENFNVLCLPCQAAAVKNWASAGCKSLAKHGLERFILQHVLCSYDLAY